MPDPQRTLADLFNIPRAGETEFEGKAYPIREPTLVEQGHFSRWLEHNAYASVARMRHLPEAERREHRKGVRDDAAAGEFEYGGYVSAKALGTLDGMAKMRSITLQADGYDECDPAFCRRMILADVERAAADLIVAGADDPKVKAALDLILGPLMKAMAGARGTTGVDPTKTSAGPTSPTSGTSSTA